MTPQEERKLLEQVARNAGYELGPWNEIADGYKLPGPMQYWNPRDDLDDRYRMARDCKAWLDFEDGEATAPANGCPSFRFIPGDDASEYEAILRACAASVKP